MFNQEKPEVAAAQKVMLEILCEIHRICVENNIKYWLFAGTLLGAVRHKGFIPWDDDCDVGMLREDYERFLQIAPQKLPDSMLLQSPGCSKDYRLLFSKIRKKGTLLIETGETGKEDYDHGVFVDIFPFDCYSSNMLLKFIHWTYVFRDKRKKYAKGSLKRVLVTFYVNVLMALPVSIAVAVRNYCVKHREHFVSSQNPKYISTRLGCDPGIPGVCINDCLPVKLGHSIFEGYDFYIPHDENICLRRNFGNNFMELPPEGQRKVHSKYIEV